MPTKNASGTRTVNQENSAGMQFAENLFQLENSVCQTTNAQLVLDVKISNAKRSSNSKERHVMKTMNVLESSLVTSLKGQNLSGAGSVISSRRLRWS